MNDKDNSFFLQLTIQTQIMFLNKLKAKPHTCAVFIIMIKYTGISTQEFCLS